METLLFFLFIVVFFYLLVGVFCSMVSRIYLKRSWKKSLLTILTWGYETLADRDA